MSAQYRDPPQWKQNASQGLDVELFQRLQAAAKVCDRFLDLSAMQLDLVREHMDAGGDFLEVLVGTEKYEKIRAAAEEEAKGSGSFSSSSEKVPDPLVSEAAPGKGSGTFLPDDGKKEPDPSGKTDPKPKRRYMPRLNAPPFYLLAARVLEVQQELAPLVHALGQHLLAAGVDIRRLQDDEIIAQVVRDEFGMDLEQISAVEYELMRDTIVKSQEWIRQFKREHAEEIRQMESGGPDPGGASATGG